MFTHEDHSTGVQLHHVLATCDLADGTTEIAVRAAGAGLRAGASILLSPSDLARFIDHLIMVYNSYVDRDLVDTTRYSTS